MRSVWVELDGRSTVRRALVDVNTWPIEDLYLVPSEDSLDDDGDPIYCVFSHELDGVTFVDADEVAVLRRRGIQTLDRLPD